MKTEILITGDEILKGEITDTNSSYISSRLMDVGIKPSRLSITGDDEHEIASIINEISRRAEIAIVTGGLGPTSDDVTASSAAKAAGTDLVENTEALDMIVSRLNEIGSSLNSSNRKQALIPSSAQYIENYAGIAPGFTMQINNCKFFFMPGVPFEMKRMLESSVLPAICEIKGIKSRFIEHKITIHGVPEALANELLSGFRRAFPSIGLAFRALSPGVFIKIFKEEKDSADATIMKKALMWISDKFGTSVISTSGQTLEEAVGSILSSKKIKIALAESCTGGLISHMITSVPGSSDYFLLSAVTYSNSSKISILGVDPETLKKFGAVHEKTAMEMAEGAKKVSGADYGLSITGIAGPGGGTPDKPVGTVCIGISGPSGTRATKFLTPGFDRAMTKRRFACQAMDMLRKEILKN